jgi:hypothetical protein
MDLAFHDWRGTYASFAIQLRKKHCAQSSHSGSLIHFKMIGLGDLHFGDPLGTLKSGRLQPYFLRSALSFTSSDLCFTLI